MSLILAEYQKYALELYELFVPIALRVFENKVNLVQKKIQQRVFSAHPDWQFASYKDKAVSYEKDKSYLAILGPIEKGLTIALIDAKAKTPVVGIAVDPAKRLVYFGIKGGGAYVLAYLSNFELGLTNRLRPVPMPDYEEFTCSKNLLSRVKEKKFIAPENGVLEIVRYRGTLSLTTGREVAAAFVIVSESGGKITDKEGKPWSLNSDSVISARVAADYDYLKNLLAKL